MLILFLCLSHLHHQFYLALTHIHKYLTYDSPQFSRSQYIYHAPVLHKMLRDFRIFEVKKCIVYSNKYDSS
jgi:hypothetical protein